MVAKLLTGRLSRHRDGYGFVIPDTEVKGMNGDIFISPPALGDAMHGDRVEVRLIKLDDRGRGEGRIQKVIRRAHATVVGQFCRGKGYNYVQPQDSRLSEEIIIPRGQEIPQEDLSKQRTGSLPKPADLEGAIVNVELTRFPNSAQKARGKVIEILGRPGDFGLDVEIIIRKHHLPHRFPPEVLAAAAAAPQQVSADVLAGRRDFRNLPIVTIDGETARDFDDAVLVEELPNGHFQLQVHIADVAHYVRQGTELDREARLRGTSVYFPDRAVPMLPVELSTGICSLNPQVDRLVMSCLMEVDRQGDITSYEICEGVIRSAERMTYTAVNAVLEGDAAARERYAALAGRFEKMRELALILNKKRERRGSIDFDLPEASIQFDEMGQMTSIVRSERNIAHRIIEEFMLAANETVAGHFAHREIPTLYRIHEMPDPKKVLDFEEIAATFGYSLGIGNLAVKRFAMPTGRTGGRDKRRKPEVVELAGDIKVTPRHYQRLCEKIAGKPEEHILAFLMLRSLKQARYSEVNHGHFGLAAPLYLHFTSPIRRYPDLIVHRLLKGPQLNKAALDAIANETSDAERRAQDAERELLEWKKVAFMADRVGDVYDALIVSVMKFGFFVELLDLFVEGLVPLDLLDDDHYYYRDATREIVGSRTKRSFKLGKRLKVRVERVDDVAHKITFAPTAD